MTEDQKADVKRMVDQVLKVIDELGYDIVPKKQLLIEHSAVRMLDKPNKPEKTIPMFIASKY